jgi:hypothetical protein
VCFGVCALVAGTTTTAVNDLNLFPGESSSDFSISAWIRLTSTGTNYGTRNIARKESFFIFQLNTLGSAGKNYAVRHCPSLPLCACACCVLCVRVRVRSVLDLTSPRAVMV